MQRAFYLYTRNVKPYLNSRTAACLECRKQASSQKLVKEEMIDFYKTELRREIGLATVTKQGPWGQAYFHGDKSSLMEFGAAMKAPKEYPFIERYKERSGAMYISVIIEELFEMKMGWEDLHPIIITRP